MAGRAGGYRARRASIVRGLALVAALAIAACAQIERNHGYVPTDADLALLEVGRDTRATVAQVVGRPSAQGLLNDTGWFYVQSRFRHFGPREPVEIDRQVVAITFDSRGTLANVERFGLQDGKVVALSRRVTESNIKGVSFLRQLFSSFGRISAGDILN